MTNKHENCFIYLGGGQGQGAGWGLPLLDFSSLKGLFSGQIFLQKKIFFPGKFPENDHFFLLLSSEL